MPNRFDASRFRKSSSATANRNVAWINSRGALLGYLFLIVSVGWLLCLLFPLPDAATAVFLIHFVVAFYLFHWVQGAPIDGTFFLRRALTLRATCLVAHRISVTLGCLPRSGAGRGASSATSRARAFVYLIFFFEDESLRQAYTQKYVLSFLLRQLTQTRALKIFARSIRPRRIYESNNVGTNG